MLFRYMKEYTTVEDPVPDQTIEVLMSDLDKQENSLSNMDKLEYLVFTEDMSVNKSEKKKFFCNNL